MTAPKAKKPKEKKPDPIDLALIEEQTVEGMKIKRIGRGHYICHSLSHPEKAYAVDLAEHDGLGSCQCEDFLYRRLPRWKRVQKLFNAFRCQHIRGVRDHCLDQIIHYYASHSDPAESRKSQLPQRPRVSSQGANPEH